MPEVGALAAGRAGEWAHVDRDLEQEVKDLLCQMVEAEASIPRVDRQKFMLRTAQQGCWLSHPGFAPPIDVLPADLDLLVRYDLLMQSYHGRGAGLYAISPSGRRYYEHLRSDEDQRIERIENVTLRRLETGGFGKRHARAYELWRRADDLAWSEDAADRQAEIGHNCRDALVAFATGLVDRHKPKGVNTDPEKFLNRLGAVFTAREVSTTVSDALGGFWQYVATLTMRQDKKDRHQPGGLTSEDGRRVVFLTAMAMVEADRFLA